MEDFIRRYSEKILKYKKDVFKQKTARDFVEKQILKSEEESKKELKKCLFPKEKFLPENAIKEREEFIEKFMKELKDLKEKKKNDEEKKSKSNNIIND